MSTAKGVVKRIKLGEIKIAHVHEDPYGHVPEGSEATLEDLYYVVDEEIANRGLDAEFNEIRVRGKDGKYYRPVIKVFLEECDKPQ